MKLRRKKPFSERHDLTPPTTTHPDHHKLANYCEYLNKCRNTLTSPERAETFGVQFSSTEASRTATQQFHYYTSFIDGARAKQLEKQSAKDLRNQELLRAQEYITKPDGSIVRKYEAGDIIPKPKRPAPAPADLITKLKQHQAEHGKYIQGDFVKVQPVTDFEREYKRLMELLPEGLLAAKAVVEITDKKAEADPSHAFYKQHGLQRILCPECWTSH
jgi:hypothetical protein